MLQSVVTSVDDGHSPGCGVNSRVMADIPGDKCLGSPADPLLQGASPCAGAHSYPAHRFFQKFLSGNQDKGKAECFFHPLRQLPNGHGLL